MTLGKKQTGETDDIFSNASFMQISLAEKQN